MVAKHKNELESLNNRDTELATLVTNLETTRAQVAWYASKFFPQPDEPQAQEQPEGNGERGSVSARHITAESYHRR